MVEKERFRRPSWPTINLQTRRSTVGCGLRRTSRIIRICCESANDPVFMAKKRLIRQDNGETALHRAAKGSHPSSLNSIVLSPVWIPSPSLRLHTGPGLQTKTLAHEDVPCAKSHMTWKIVMPTRTSPWNKGSPSYRKKRSVMLITAKIVFRRIAQKREHARNAKGHTPLYSI